MASESDDEALICEEKCLEEALILVEIDGTFEETAAVAEVAAGGSWKPVQWLCSSGHRLGRAIACPEPGERGFCDRCGSTISSGEPVLQCRRCDFDVCDACEKEPVPGWQSFG